MASFALFSTIMPRGVGHRPSTYKPALLVALTVAVLAAIFGALSIAVLVAAFAIPVVYIVYLYDVNLWEDEPVPVTLMAFVLTGALAVGFTLLWTWLRGPRGSHRFGLTGAADAGPSLGTFLLVTVLVPIGGEVLKQVGPLVLASRPAFDDLMDGLTFGVISGVAYATFDTLVRHWDLFTGGFVGTQDPALWASLLVLGVLIIRIRSILHTGRLSAAGRLSGWPGRLRWRGRAACEEQEQCADPRYRRRRGVVVRRDRRRGDRAAQAARQRRAGSARDDLAAQGA